MLFYVVLNYILVGCPWIVPGGCRPEGCCGYFSACLQPPQFFQVHAPHPTIIGNGS